MPMESIFTVNDAEIIRTVLLDGFRLQSSNSRQEAIANELARLGLIRIDSRDYVICANTRDRDYGYADPECRNCFYLDERLSDETVYCGHCDRGIDLDDKQIFQKQIVRLDTSGVFRYIVERFNSAGFNVGAIRHGRAFFETEGKVCVLCVLSHCTNARYLSYHYVYSSPILYVFLPYMRPSCEALPHLKYILLEDMICLDKSWLRERVADAFG